MRKVLIALALLVSVAAMAADYKDAISVQCTDGTTDTQYFRIQGTRPDINGLYAYGKNGIGFWIRYKCRGVWAAVPQYATFIEIPTSSDSAEITPAVADTVYISGME